MSNVFINLLQPRCSSSNGCLTRPRCWRTTWAHQCPKSSGTTFTRWATIFAARSPTSRTFQFALVHRERQLNWSRFSLRAVFSPSCISHTVLTKRDWQSVRIGEVSLPQALRCWELQPYWSISNHLLPQSNHRHRHHHHSQETKRVSDYDQKDTPTTHHHKHNGTPTLPAK